MIKIRTGGVRKDSSNLLEYTREDLRKYYNMLSEHHPYTKREKLSVKVVTPPVDRPKCFWDSADTPLYYGDDDSRPE